MTALPAIIHRRAAVRPLRGRLVRALLVAVLLGGNAARAADSPAAPTPADLEKSGSVVELPGVTVHGGTNRVAVVDAAISLTDAILEFAVVETGGRDYESLLVTPCRPSTLQFALLLMGCEPGPLPRLAKPGERAGDRLRLEVEWEHEGARQRHPLEHLLIDRRTRQPFERPRWIFSGSYFSKKVLGEGEVYMADVEQAHVALWWSRSVLINLDQDHGNPYAGEDEGFEVNRARVPPAGTPVRLRIWKDE